MLRLKVLLAVAAVFSTSQMRSAEPLFTDDFKNGLKPGWTWIREDKSAWRTTDDGLEIRIQRGNMWGPENSGKNVLVRELPKIDQALEISVTVEHKPTEQYEQADLVAYYDDSHQVKIGEELVDGKLSIVMGREEKDRARTIAIIPLAKNRVELKLRIDGQHVSGFYRPEGEKEWKKAGECDLPGVGKPRIAIETYQGSDEKEHWAKIQKFRITAVDGK
jgi:beta-xylosidase